MSAERDEADKAECGLAASLFLNLIFAISRPQIGVVQYLRGKKYSLKYYQPRRGDLSHVREILVYSAGRRHVLQLGK